MFHWPTPSSAMYRCLNVMVIRAEQDLCIALGTCYVVKGVDKPVVIISIQHFYASGKYVQYSHHSTHHTNLYSITTPYHKSKVLLYLVVILCICMLQAYILYVHTLCILNRTKSHQFAPIHLESTGFFLIMHNKSNSFDFS